MNETPPLTQNGSTAAPVTPQLHFPEELPVAQRREEIARAIQNHQVVIIAGETGSGKTTQLPKICLQLGRGAKGMIGHTQPRRLAARTVAQRIAEELGEELGQTVGYQVRFADRVSADSRVKLMTDGILLSEMQGDRLLKKYDTIIIDEAHERSLNIDFLLGYLKQILPRRPDLKLIITSATIDVDSFANHFDKAPVIEVSGRTFPIDTHYLEADSEDADLNERIADVLEQVQAGEYGARGDTLVFLSGERDIRELARLLRGRAIPNLEVLPLYARLSHAEQNRVFQTGKRRGSRVVLATNVAETSLTVPGIRYVIDPGYARISRYSYRTKLQRLPIEPVSQASANQRQGRCGRIAKGVCLRLYSEDDFNSRPEFTEPEIRRTNLGSVILQMLRLKLGTVDKFPFINPPDQRLVRDGYKLLEELSAVDARGRITSVGRRMAEFPVDPRFARMLLSAAEAGCLREVLVITSGLSVQDPRERPADKQQAADQQHRRFWHERSDFLAWWNLWKYYEEQRQALSQSQLRKLCKREFLAFMRMREWRDTHFQLTVACKRAGLKQSKVEATYDVVHKALLSGLLGNLAQWHEGFEYRGSRNRKLQIFPGSSQFKQKPKWLLAGEVVETSKVYARDVAAIDPRWALDINPSLLKHHYYEPHWQARSGRVVAFERVSLYGLVLVDKQRIHYGPVNPAEAREIFIRGALVEARLKQQPAFLRYNRKQVAELEKLESKVRRRDLVVDEQAVFEFYQERLPDSVNTLNRLRSWLKKEKGADASLRMSRAQLLLRQVDEELGNQFPDSLAWADMTLALRYHFEPGHAEDGVSVSIPIGLLNRIPRYRLEWLVPGLLREKCIQAVRGLPKNIRKHLVPVPDFVDRALADMPVEDKPLLDVLGDRLLQISGSRIERSTWQDVEIDTYYQMNIRIVDAEGKLLHQGRNLAVLLEQCRNDVSRETVTEEADDSPVRRNLLKWPDADVPSKWRMRQAGVDIESYPALVDQGDSVAVELLDYPAQAELAHRRGLLRLFRLQCAQPLRFLRKQLLRGNDCNLVLAGAGMEREGLLDDLVDGCCMQAFLGSEELPRTEQDFKLRLQQGRGELVRWGNEYESLLLNTLATLAAIRRQLAELNDREDSVLREDIERQLKRLLGLHFLRDTPFEWLRHFPRYIKAVDIRLQRWSGQRQKDLAYTERLAEQGQGLLEVLELQPDALQLSGELIQYRWMLEEFRVSLFAQALGTSLPVSAKRLQEQWEKVQEWAIQNPI
jgi:ATP-dependent helicase HrpA